MQAVKTWLKQSETPLAKALFKAAKKIRAIELPTIHSIHKPLYWLHTSLVNGWNNTWRILYWTPLFKSQLRHCGRGFLLYSGMPLVLGKLNIRIGDNSRMSGISTLCGRASAITTPELIIGNNVDVGWQNTIAVGTRVVLGHNVRLAGKVFLAGFPGHPINAQQRAAGLPEHDDQVGDIVLEDDVWLATGVTVMAGVHIGRGTVVAAGSVVTHDLPPGVIAGGMPAKVIKTIQSSGAEYDATK